MKKREILDNLVVVSSSWDVDAESWTINVHPSTEQCQATLRAYNLRTSPTDSSVALSVDRKRFDGRLNKRPHVSHFSGIQDYTPQKGDVIRAYCNAWKSSSGKDYLDLISLDILDGVQVTPMVSDRESVADGAQEVAYWRDSNGSTYPSSEQAWNKGHGMIEPCDCHGRVIPLHKLPWNVGEAEY